MSLGTRRDQVQRRILQAAGEVFAARGYQQATIREICRRADVNGAAVNYYFREKERLYIAAVKHARSLIEERLPLPKWPKDTPAERKLELYIETFLGRLLSGETAAWQTRLLMREIIEPTRACAEMVQESFRPFFAILLEILRELLPAETPEPHLHQTGFSIVAQCVFYRAHGHVVEMIIGEQERRTYFDLPQLARHITHFSLSAVHAASDCGWAPVKSWRGSKEPAE